MAANNKFRRYKNLLRYVLNWPSYLLFKTGLLSRGKFVFHMRNGFHIPVARGMMGPFRECFLNDQYLFPFRKEPFPENPLFLDIGSNVGFAALYFFYHYPYATVHSFEPMPFCIEYMKTLQKEMPFLQWTLHPYGLWSSQRTLELFTDTTDSFTTTAGVLLNTSRSQKINVPVYPLADFIEKKGRKGIDLMKMDCEGAEYEILFSLTSDHYRLIRRIVVELHPNTDYSFSYMKNYLQKQGYEIVAEEQIGAYGMIWAKLKDVSSS